MKRLLATLTIAAFGMVPILAAIPAQATGTPAHVNVTVASATTLTMVNATCNLGSSVLPGTTVSTDNCITYSVSTNNATGFELDLNVDVRDPNLVVGSDFSVRRHLQVPWNTMNYNAGQTGGAESTPGWRTSTGPSSATYGDDFRFVAAATQTAGALHQDLIYNAGSNA